ncbi:MAG TPA: glycerol kinase GlpK [Candidatus Avanaerovorax faecigallinarum]|nr:glycerol kinase GlpK [Candidatus Avanaerovorax faecigallinarum]
MDKYIMALDQGTSSSRCIIYDRAGRQISSAQKEFTQIFPKEGWVEHDPEEIWSSQVSVCYEALIKAAATWHNIEAIGITNQRETTIVWDKNTGEPVYNAIVWQCRRTADYCRSLEEAGLADKIKEKTGLLIDPYFSATKIRWILENVEGARERAERGELLFGTVETWLIWKMTKGRVHATDYSNASRTMMFNIHDLKWDEELLDIYGIPASMLPEIKQSSGFFGETESDLFAGSIPIAGAAGDQQAALFGQMCFDEGMAKSTYGTGCFLLMNTGEKPVTSKNGLLTTVAWGLNGKVSYALEGSVFVCGAVIQWLRDELGIISSAAESEGLAKAVSDNGGVYLVPAFAGLGAPYWDPGARGILTGLTRGSSRNHIVRAALESMAYQCYDLLKAMESDLGRNLTGLRVDGGACANGFLMQFQSDILNTAVYRPEIIETTSLGAAYLAGLATGYWKNTEDLKANVRPAEVFEPSMDEELREKLIKGWHEAVGRCRSL